MADFLAHATVVDRLRVRAKVCCSTQTVCRGGSSLSAVRTKVVQYIRRFLEERNFIEVETPILSPQIGGANARPFATEAVAMQGVPLYLRIAPELYLKVWDALA